MLLVQDGVDGQTGGAGGVEHLLGSHGIGSSGTLDSFESAVAREFEAVAEGERGGKHVELDGFFYGKTRGAEEWNGGECKRCAAGQRAAAAEWPVSF